MPRYKIFIEYEGTNYSGWQKQPNSNTVEDQIEKALAQILRHPVDIIAQGRTDRGVHAEGQVAHFDFPNELKHDQLLFGLLGVLPRNIAVWDIKKADPNFHARFDAVSRRYRYQIARRPAPLQRLTSQLILETLDLHALHVCAKEVEGLHNFDSFTKPNNENPDSFCEVKLSTFSQKDHFLIYDIEANRFVRHMVRRLVGTMIQVGKGKRSVKEFVDMIKRPSKSKNAYGATAKGLTLAEVRY